MSIRISRHGIAMCFAVMMTHPVLAADWIVRDPSGRRIETLDKSYGDKLIRRDEQGRRLGTIEPGHGDRLIIRDERGRREASSRKASAAI